MDNPMICPNPPELNCSPTGLLGFRYSIVVGQADPSTSSDVIDLNFPSLACLHNGKP